MPDRAPYQKDSHSDRPDNRSYYFTMKLKNSTLPVLLIAIVLILGIILLFRFVSLKIIVPIIIIGSAIAMYRERKIAKAIKKGIEAREAYKKGPEQR